MSFSVCIYEDNNNLRESLCSLLSLTEQYQVEAAFADCLDIEKQIKAHHPDIILMDIDLPGLNGIEAVKKIRSFNKEAQVIMLTIFDDDEHVFAALHAGANGYLLKKNISDKLIPSIHDVLNGGAPMSPAIARMIIDKMQVQPVPQAADYHLTAREKEILSFLSKGNSHKMIAAALGISIETVRSHLKKIYDKLHVHSQTEALSKAFNEKLV
ncbi:MAG: response regulator transcription factor [Ferruginibacter sp.]